MNATTNAGPSSRIPLASANTAGVLQISICIATYRRPEKLKALLKDLTRQILLPMEVVVVDNDNGGSAEPIVTELRMTAAPFPIQYAVQPLKNVAITRNQTVALAKGDWLAFVDDDERTPPEWLSSLVNAAAIFNADAVLGPVEPMLPFATAAWITRGDFYTWGRMQTGSRVPAHLLRFGNVLLNAAILRAQNPVFDPAYGLTGGEDGDLLTRLQQAGSKIVWCDEAVVSEPVDPSRLSLRWLLLRSLRGGQDFSRHVLAGRYGRVTVLTRIHLLLRSLLQMIAAGALALLCLPLGLHFSAHWLIKVAANLGKLTVFLGFHYREYA